MKRSLVGGGLALCLLSCGPREVRNTEPARVWNIDARTLHNSYRDRAERWTGQIVRLHLPRESYMAVGSELHWYSREMGAPPAIVVACPSGYVSPVPAPAVEVVGVCLGATDDGKRRSDGTRFHVTLRAHSVQPAR